MSAAEAEPTTVEGAAMREVDGSAGGATMTVANAAAFDETLPED